jgi:hypothetical protein
MSMRKHIRGKHVVLRARIHHGVIFGSIKQKLNYADNKGLLRYIIVRERYAHVANRTTQGVEMFIQYRLYYTVTLYRRATTSFIIAASSSIYLLFSLQCFCTNLHNHETRRR